MYNTRIIRQCICRRGCCPISFYGKFAVNRLTLGQVAVWVSSLCSVSMHIVLAALCQYAYRSCCALSVCMSFLLRFVSMHIIPAALCQYAYRSCCALSVCISFLQCFVIIFILISHLSKGKWAMHGNLHKNNFYLKYWEAWKEKHFNTVLYN